MKSLFSFLTQLAIKAFSNLFFRFEIKWPNDDKNIDWNQVRMIVLLNHTSLLEPLYLGFLPIRLLWRLSKKMVAPGADKTLNRPIVGFFYKVFSPGMVAITRKRDDSWKQFMEAIAEDSLIVIIPEGRMKRKNGLDLNGNKMTVKSGIAEVLEGLHSGNMILAYSGGLHHVHVPGEKGYHFFKTLKMNLELLDIADYKNIFPNPIGSEEWRKSVIADLQHRLETKVPVLDE
jgi:1-acyl-sn-glycerol-3-phosphate acyltransferase